jgi:predicted AAA+ superfamily ATPase
MASKQDYLNYIIKQINTTPHIAKEFLKCNDGKFNHRIAFNNLKYSVDTFLDGFNENRLTIMPGLRGVGKSTLLFQTYEYLIANGVDENRILYVPADELNTLNESSLLELINIFVEDVHHKYPATLKDELFILIDESQEDDKWSQTAKILYDQSKKIFMIFTGSNALDFELNLNTIRRTSFERIYPMNFQEYLNLKYGIPLIAIGNDIRDIFLTGDVESASEKETEMMTLTSSLGKPLMKEFEYFLSYGGFPFNFNLDEIATHRRIFEVVRRVIEKDVRHHKSFNGNTQNVLFAILSFLATQKPGGISVNSLAKNMGTSRGNVIELLDILEKTHLIFHVDPYGRAGKMIRAPKKYYFLSPSINAAINFTLGKHTPNNNDYLGILAETLVASSFFRLNKTISRPNGIFTPTQKGMADFIVTTFEGDRIAVEVGIGKKGKSQVKKTMNKYNCQNGVVVSSATNLIEKEDEIIFLPLTTFSLM